jgi:hypothetical protein
MIIASLIGIVLSILAIIYLIFKRNINSRPLIYVIELGEKPLVHAGFLYSINEKDDTISVILPIYNNKIYKCKKFKNNWIITDENNIDLH